MTLLEQLKQSAADPTHADHVLSKTVLALDVLLGEYNDLILAQEWEDAATFGSQVVDGLAMFFETMCNNSPPLWREDMCERFERTMIAMREGRGT